MKIAVNTRLLMPGKLDGIGWFTYETMRRIVKDHPEHTFYFIFDRSYSDEVIFGDNVVPVVLPPPTRHPLLWYVWFELRIPRLLRKIGADMFLSTDGFISLRSDVPSCNVIHDINFEHRPRDLPWLSRKYYRYFYPRYAHAATRLATVSEYSRRDIINTYEVDEDKIDLVYNGASKNFFPVTSERAQEVRDRYTGGAPYFIFVGSIHPRKNIRNLLRAFELFREEYRSPFKLVIVGKKFFLTKAMEDQLDQMKYKQDVIFAGRVDSEDMNDIMASAWALTFVPFFEGFGIPLVEAMNCDIPILASKVTSLPEIAGDAAIYAEPESPGSIRDGMIRIVREEGLREQLIEKGKSRRKRYSWDHTARELWKTIEKVLNEHA
ncbi:MAG: glycosyltransferase family 1 protein [Bacteroidales bacterium]|nr:glycosyltransferase family 1 protein [Bacteroidales bacterium]MDT8432699.1 glycosyltransferase family 1 protein [Bacteroidales bacterium]